MLYNLFVGNIKKFKILIKKVRGNYELNSAKN